MAGEKSGDAAVQAAVGHSQSLDLVSRPEYLHSSSVNAIMNVGQMKSAPTSYFVFESARRYALPHSWRDEIETKVSCYIINYDHLTCCLRL